MSAYGPETYGESFADVYDDWYGSVSDIDATVAGIVALAGEGPVLELGVGTGRLALPIAATGLEVVGIDASPAMLAVLAAKPGADAIRAIEADMAAPPLEPDHFTLAFAAFNTWFNLVDADAQHRCAAALAATLRAGGMLAVEGFVPPAEGLADGGLSLRRVAERRVVISVSAHHDTDQTISGRHIDISDAGVVTRPWLLHYRTPVQLDELFAEHGFALAHRHRDWRGTPFESEADTHVSVYRLG